MTPTTWTEHTVTGTGWTEGVPEAGVAADDYFIDFLFEGTLFFNNIVSYTEHTVPTAVHTELTVPSASWAEITA